MRKSRARPPDTNLVDQLVPRALLLEELPLDFVHVLLAHEVHEVLERERHELGLVDRAVAARVRGREERRDLVGLQAELERLHALAELVAVELARVVRVELVEELGELGLHLLLAAAVEVVLGADLGLGEDLGLLGERLGVGHVVDRLGRERRELPVVHLRGAGGRARRERG